MHALLSVYYTSFVVQAPDFSTNADSSIAQAHRDAMPHFNMAILLRHSIQPSPCVIPLMSSVRQGNKKYNLLRSIGVTTVALQAERSI